MKMQITKKALVTCLTVLTVVTVRAQDSLQTESEQAKNAFIAKDSTMQKTMDAAAGYVIFPSVGKGGFIVGGAHGKGLVYQQGKVIGQATMTQASVGAQVGGQTFSEMILFQT